MAILLCVLSLFVPLFGIVIGVIWMGAEVDAERRRIGKTCLLLGILCVVLWVVIAALGLSWHMY